MQTTLKKLSQQTMELVTSYAAKNDVEAIQQLSSAASRIKQIQDRMAAIELEVASIESFLEGFHGTRRTDFSTEPIEFDEKPERRSRNKKLQITIDWSRAGRAGGVETISENTSSASMAKFAKRLIAFQGDGVLETLSNYRVNRGPLVSRFPERDYLNPSTGATYGHQRIDGTAYSILTHSANTEKVADLRELTKVLKLPFGMVKIEEVEK